jgi:hypothetical protein
MDPLHFCIAIAPLAAYLCLLGLIHLSVRPFVTNGTRDSAALGVALLGFAIVGPMDLFMPQDLVYRWGWGAWVLLLIFYALCVTLVILMARPRILIYNVTSDQLRPTLSDVVNELDKGARWAGTSLSLPDLGVQLHFEANDAMRIAQLTASGPKQNALGWRVLETALRKALVQTKSPPNPYGFALLSGAAICVVAASIWLLADGENLSESLVELIYRI